MTRLAAQKVQENFSDTLDRVADKGERIILQRNGKDVAVLISLEDLAWLEELEDRLDLEDFRAAKEEWEREGRQTTPLDEVVKELGIKA
jgi:prevent-host-death family protein